MYVSPNYASKKALRDAIAKGCPMTFYNPGLGPMVPTNGTIFVEGPHFPKPHTWYARVTLREGKPVSIR